MLALTGGAAWQPAMAGSLHPPFSLFIPGMKRENGPCTVQKRKARGRGYGGAQEVLPLIRMSPARGVVLAGVLVVIESTPFSFRCRCPGGCGDGRWPYPDLQAA